MFKESHESEKVPMCNMDCRLKVGRQPLVRWRQPLQRAFTAAVKMIFVEVGDRPIIDHLTGVAKHQKQAELMVIAIYIRKKSSRGNVSPARAQSP